MKLENEQRVDNYLQRERLHTEETALSAQYTETHASLTLLDLKNTPSQSSVTINILSLNEEKDEEDEEEEEISNSSKTEEFNRQSSTENFESSWRENPKIIHKTTRFIYNSEFNDDLNKEGKKIDDEDGSVAYINSEFRHSIIDDQKSEGHELDIVDYYERYSPLTAKALINTLLLSRKEICKQCARFEDSPVYSDRLIYGKKFLHAREIGMFQFGDVVNFTIVPSDFQQSFQFGDYMPICNLPKTNGSGIFYLSSPLDVFDMKSSLEPGIVLMNSKFNGIVNTQVYHRYERNFYSRISQNENFSPSLRNNSIITKNFDYETNLNSWMDFCHREKLRNSKDDFRRESQPHRTSLLLLEPLIFMPNFPPGKRSFSKSPISHADSLTLVKIVIAYTMAFFTVTIITFYIVYFT